MGKDRAADVRTRPEVELDGDAELKVWRFPSCGVKKRAARQKTPASYTQEPVIVLMARPAATVDV